MAATARPPTVGGRPLNEVLDDMFKLLRRVFGGTSSPSASDETAFDPQQFIYVMLPGDIQPIARGERFEDPLEKILQDQRLGTISGGGSQMDDPYPDGRPRVAFCGLDVEVTDRDAALPVIRSSLVSLSAPTGTELHYTAGTDKLLDRLGDGGWQTHLPRNMLHPGFNF
jgi:hypothetical protein